MTQSLDSLIQDFIEFQNEFEKKAQEKLKEIFVDYWTKNPEVKAIVWTQYAPHYSDGDPCVFGVNEPFVTNAEGDDLDYLGRYDYNGNNENVWCVDRYDSKWPNEVDKESTIALLKVLTLTALESVMESAFGSDSRIIATREGFQVEDYSDEHN